MSNTFCRERIAMDLCRPTLCCTSSFILFLIITQSVPSAPQKVEDEKEFDYLEGSAKGPKHWGELHPEWKACSNGNMQSPIALLQGRAEVLPNLGRLKREYKPAEAILMNKGHVIMLQWGEIGAGTIEINQTQYVLKQCHWHSPSEHSLDGSRYDLEMHMVHQRSDGRTAVVAVIYKVGLQDHFLLKVTDAIEDITDKTGSEVKVGLVNPEDAIDLEREPYYRYLGSLTTPPCDEGVMWTVIKEVKTFSKEQLEKLRAAVEDGFENNARPIQPLNQRQLYIFNKER